MTTAASTALTQAGEGGANKRAKTTFLLPYSESFPTRDEFGSHLSEVELKRIADGAAAFERREGTATVHKSQIVHGVTCMTHGVRHALIVFFGHEPAVRRVLVRGDDGVDRWDRVVVDEDDE